jgi:hypothetical protein
MRQTPTIWMPNVKGAEPEKDYNEIYAHDSPTVAAAKLETWIAKKIGTHLMEKFPQREWGIRIDLKGKIVIIVCESVSITRGYHIHMSGKTVHQMCEASADAAGEILERHGITRGKKYNADTTEAMERDLQGDMIGGDNG